MTKELKETLSDLAAVLLAAVALWKAVVELRGTLQQAGGEIWKNWPWYGVAVLALLVVLLWRRDRLARLLAPRSMVAEREAFHIGRRYLLGREQDIEHLLETLASSPLVFLRGESGAGKSSLLERGVLPRLKETPGLAPILIDSWGPDWIEGPREAVARAVNALLDEPLRKTLGIEGAVAPTGALRVLARLRTEAQRTPVLLFDQLDDYQTRHREKFLSGSGTGRTLLKPDELRAQNPFWNEIADLLSQGTIRCLFAIRSDAKMGLECVSFRQPTVYILDPLTRGTAAELLVIVAKTGVEHPERSFDPLAKRLLDDLSHDGLVLPIQMQVAFSGLAELNALSVGEYEKQGGLPGLQALHLKTRIAASARAVAAAPAEVRTVLLAMVNPSDPRKTEARTTGELLTVLPGRDPEFLQELLDKLSIDEVVRARLGTGSEGRVWQLDHDYLTGGVQELERRNRMWALYFEESARLYRRARGPYERWARLLPPSKQILVLIQALRGKVKYGENYRYAVLSTLRFLIWLIVFTLAWFFWQGVAQWERANSLCVSMWTSSSRRSELAEIALASRFERRRFLDCAFSPEGADPTLHFSPDVILNAAVGLRERDRQYVIGKTVRSTCLETKNINSRRSMVLGLCEDIISRLSPDARDMKKVSEAWLELPHDQIFHLCQIVNFVPSFERRQLANLIVSKLSQGKAWPEYCSNSKIAESMSNSQVEKVKNYILTSKDVEASQAIGSRLSREERREIIEAIGREELRHLVEESQSYRRELTSKEAVRLFKDGWIHDDRFDDELISQISSLDSRALMAELLDLQQGDISPVARRRLLEAASALAERLSKSDSELVAEQIFDQIGKAKSRRQLIGLIAVFGSLGGRVTADQSLDALQLITEIVQGPAGRDQELFLQLLAVLGPSSLTQVVIDGNVDAVLNQTRRNAYDPLLTISVLEKYAEKMSQSSAERTLAFAVVQSKKDAKSPMPKTESIRAIGGLIDKLWPRLAEADKRYVFANFPVISPIEFSFLEDMPSSEAHLVLKELSRRFPMDCRNLAPLIRDPIDDNVIDLIKRPNCGDSERADLIKRIDALVTGQRFGAIDEDGIYQPDIWGKFVPWAEKEGLDLESPPKLPDLDKLKIN